MITPTSDEFRDRALFKFLIEGRKKYDQGQEEHGGHILNRDALAEAAAETIDQWNYIQAAMIQQGQQRERVVKLERAMAEIKERLERLAAFAPASQVDELINIEHIIFDATKP